MVIKIIIRTHVSIPAMAYVKETILCGFLTFVIAILSPVVGRACN